MNRTPAEKAIQRERHLAEKRERERKRRIRMKAEAAAAAATGSSTTTAATGGAGLGSSPGGAADATPSAFTRSNTAQPAASATQSQEAPRPTPPPSGPPKPSWRHRASQSINDRRGGDGHSPSGGVSIANARKVWESLVANSATFRKLASLERDVDRAILRRQADLQRALNAPVARADQRPAATTPRTLRLYLFNSVKPVDETANTAMWTLRLQGWIMPRADEVEAWKAGNVTCTKRVTELIRKVVIQLDPEQYPSDYMVEWHRTHGAAPATVNSGPNRAVGNSGGPMENNPPADGFEISRPAKKEFVAKISLTVENNPERYKLSPGLSAICGVDSETRANVFMSIWEYIKANGLQSSEDKAVILLDDRLKTLFDATTKPTSMRLSFVYEVVKTHLSPVEPIELEYHVKLGPYGRGAESRESTNIFHSSQDCYDIQIHVNEVAEFNPPDEIFSAVTGDIKFPNNPEYAALQSSVTELLDQVGAHQRRREFFERFVANPVEFINDLIVSQTRDLKTLAGSSGRAEEDERRAAFYQQQWVGEAVPRYLLRKIIAGANSSAQPPVR